VNAPAPEDRPPYLRLAHDRALEQIELGLAQFCRFLGVEEGEALEVTGLYPGGRCPLVAHATTFADLLRLLEAADRMPGLHGLYMVANQINPTMVARYEPNRWHKAKNGRASDKDISHRRVVYIDLDSERPRGVSATDEEKRPVYDVADSVQEYLEQALGVPGAIGRGDSGNGLSLFVAVESTPPTQEDDRKLERFFRMLHVKFGTDRVSIDQKVYNPARLVPAFGTMKRKGVNTPNRPHRRTYFSCRMKARRVPLEAILG
jgi:hypothetical protein